MSAVADVAIRPQPGGQTDFASNPADICIGGGQAGGGKSYGLLLEPLRHVEKRGFNAVIFRRTKPQLKAAGGLWQESLGVYPHVGGRAVYMDWHFPGGGLVQFRSLQYTKDRLAWKGAQLALPLFDQLEEFEEAQFWYLISRMRSMSGIAPYCRATANPVPEDDPIGGWLRKLIDWWINPETGFAIPERSGQLRWFVRIGNVLHWGDSRAELADKFPGKDPLSLSFVPMALEENKALERVDPGYRGKLDALPYVEQMRLLRGNWNVRATAGTIFQADKFQYLEPSELDALKQKTYIRWCRFWDVASTDEDERAKTSDDPDWTAGVKLGITSETPPRVIVDDVRCDRRDAAKVDADIKRTARDDGPEVAIREEQEPGSSGKAICYRRKLDLVGYDYDGIRSTGSKQTRWKPLSVQAKARNVFLKRAPWNAAFVKELENLPGGHDDQADGASGALNALVHGTAGGVVKLAGFGRSA